MALRSRLAVLVLAAFPLAAVGEDYLGGLKPPKEPSGFFSFASSPVNSFAPSGNPAADASFRFKLGYKYSRYLSVEGEFVDFARVPADLFASPGHLASAFRSTGFGIDTVATLPIWRSFSFYGRLGAYRGEAGNAFSTYSTSLLSGSAARGTRWRYGLGMRYDFTQTLGVRAEVERFSPLGSAFSPDVEADQVSVGVHWRF